MLNNHLKNYQIRIRSGSSSKLNKSFLHKHPSCPPSFIRFSPQIFETLSYVIFSPISQWWTITFTIPVVGSGSGSSPKSNSFVLVTHPICPQNFMRISSQFFEISCVQTNKQTDKQTNKQEKDIVQNTILAKSTPSPKVAMDTWNCSFHWHKNSQS